MSSSNRKSTNNHTLWYSRPAESWIEALPVGSGHLGAMVYGGIHSEKIKLNEDTLWSGEPKDCNNSDAINWLPKARQAAFEGRHKDAIEYSKKMLGCYNQSYQPFGSLKLDFLHGEMTPSKYSRDLNLDSGISSTRYCVGGTNFEREVFSSYPDRVVVVILKADQPNALSFDASIDTPHPHFKEAADSTSISIDGNCPIHVDPNYFDGNDNPVVYKSGKGMRFTGIVSVRTKNGSQETLADRTIQVRNADEAVLIFTLKTSFNGFDQSPSENEIKTYSIASDIIQEARKRSGAELRQRHISDHQSLYSRSSLHLEPSRCDLETYDRIQSYTSSEDPGLVALLYNFGRYLLIASSRATSQPAHLQGIWSKDIRPPWSDNWTLNINSAMNYWPSEVCNLSECHLPMLTYIYELAQNGAKTAEVHYGARGWTAHHNADIWRQTAPVGNYGDGSPCWALWAFGGVWHCMDLWEHYAYNGDQTYLRTFAYPVMKGALEFCFDWFVANDQGQLVVSPSTSPENCFVRPEDGGVGEVCAGSASDTALAWDLATRVIQTCELLKIDDDFRKDALKFRSRLRPYEIGSKGQILEWDQEYQEYEPNHRHMSHLIGFHPGNQINIDDSAELSKAVQQTMELRGDEATGWSMAWKTCIWARLRDGDRALRVMGQMLKIARDIPIEEACVTLDAGGIYPNLLGCCPPMMLDANYGVTAGIAEMLMQSHREIDGIYEIHLLPALPKRWENGEINGLKARGGFEIDISWKEGVLHETRIKSLAGNPIQIRYGDSVIKIHTKIGEVISPDFTQELIHDPL